MPADMEDHPSPLVRAAQKVQDAYLKSLQGAAPAGGDDAGKTKTELLEEARVAGITGRSRMDKDELIAALREHRAG